MPFDAVASVPCFELWLLLQFEDLLAAIHRDEVMRRLQVHLPGYAKGQGDRWAVTRDRLGAARHARWH